MSDHAVFSPSATSRWLNCPASVPLTAKLNASSGEHSIYTASGTVIHAIAERVLRAVFLDDTDYRPLLDHALSATWGYYASLPEEFRHMKVDHDMVDQVEIYLHEVRDIVDDADKVFIEKRLNYVDARLFGTVDLLVEKPDALVVCDLKTGTGNVVKAKDNPQLLTYAGLYMSRQRRSNFPVVELMIVQPPLDDPTSKWVCKASDVHAHMDHVRSAMAAGSEFNVDHLHAGPQCRWCPARAACPELDRQARLAMNTELDGLTPDQWSDVLSMATVLKPWCESVFSRANQLAVEEGLQVPGMKLVQKKGRKTWDSEKEAGFVLTEALDEAGVDLLETPELFNPAKLKTPTQVKKILKGIVDADVVEGLTTVPDRGLILVPDSDKREAVESGQNLLKAAGDIALFS